jgi:hypothetical protein
MRRRRVPYPLWRPLGVSNNCGGPRVISQVLGPQDKLAALRQRDAERCLLHDRIIAQQADLAEAHGEVTKLSEAVEAANVVIQVGC